MSAVFISGASRGIGEKLVECFAKKGYIVYANTRVEIKYDNKNIINVVFDVTNKIDVEKFVRDCKHKIDLLINNAGIISDCLIVSDTIENISNIIRVNFLACSIIVNEFLPIFSHKPCIINISSVSAILGGKGQSAYSLSKGMLIEYARYLAEIMPKNGNYFSIILGPVETDMTKSLLEKGLYKFLPLKRAISTNEVFDACDFIYANREILRNGEAITIDGGFLLSNKL